MAATVRRNNLYADCMLALDARTGKYLWHFQTMHHDLWDFDPNAAPQLSTVKHDGKDVDVVSLASKNGFLFVFERVTGKPLWPIEERPVPKSDVPGEWTSPTQPFPTLPPPFSRQGATVKDMYTLFMKDDEEQKSVDRAPLKGAHRALHAAHAQHRPDLNAERQWRHALLRHGRGSHQRYGVRARQGHGIAPEADAGGRIHGGQLGRPDSRADEAGGTWRTRRSGCGGRWSRDRRTARACRL